MSSICSWSRFSEMETLTAMGDTAIYFNVFWHAIGTPRPIYESGLDKAVPIVLHDELKFGLLIGNRSGILVPPYNASGSSLCLLLGNLGFDK